MLNVLTPSLSNLSLSPKSKYSAQFSFHSSQAPRMQRLQMPLPVAPQIFSKNRIATHGHKRHAIIVRHVAINPLTQPLLFLRPLQRYQIQAREVGPASSTIRLDVDEEGAFDVAVDVRPVGIPVRVVFVLVVGSVALHDERLDASCGRGVGWERPGSGLDALDDCILTQCRR